MASITPSMVVNYFFKKKKKFESNSWSTCILEGTDDDKLEPNEKGFASMSKYGHDVASLIGPPGVGKSTLASTIYNVMRNDKYEYFEASDCLEGFTKGIWTLKEQIKVAKCRLDKVDILDLEGLEDDDVIHYLVVVAMSLSKAILICANYNGSPRFKFDVFKTLRSGIQVYQQNGIRIPSPIIYFQVPDGVNQFKLRTKVVDKKGLIEYIKKKYPQLADFEMRPFSLPIFKNKNRFDASYMNAVAHLINEISQITEQIVIEQRIKYAFGVISALNDNSPSLILDMNLKFFQNEINKYTNTIKQNAIVTIRNDADSKILQKMIKYNEFCELISKNGKYYYGKTIKQQAISLAYYDKTQTKHNKIINDFDDEKKYYVEAKDHCKDIYDKAKSSLISLLAAKGEQLMRINKEAFEAFVKVEIAKNISKIKYNNSTFMPYSLRHIIQEKQRQLKTEIIEKTQNVIQISSDYINMEYLTKCWTIATNTLKEQWEAQKRRALTERRKVMVSGNLQCGACNTNHSNGVGCLCDSNSLYYWVDGPTNTAVCDKCIEISSFTSVCCNSCKATLNAKVITVN